METQKNERKTDFVNVRDIADFLYCPRKVFLRRVMGKRETRNKAMVKGMIRHKIYDEFNKRERFLVMGIDRPLDRDALYSLYENILFVISSEVFEQNKHLVSGYGISRELFWQEFLERAREDIVVRVNALLRLIEQNIFAEELWQKLEPKYYSEYVLRDEKLMLKGRVDRLLLSSNHVVPIEIKSCNVLEPYFTDKVQLAAYAMLAESMLGKRAPIGKLKYGNRMYTVIITDKLKNKVLEVLGKIRDMEKTREEPPISSNFRRCEKCGLRTFCFGS